MAANVEPRMLNPVSTTDTPHSKDSHAYIVHCRGVRKRPEALHALKQAPARLRPRRRRLARAAVETIWSGTRARVRLVGNDALMPVVLDHVARLVSQALGFCERVDEGLCFDGEESLLEAFVQEAVAGFADDDVGDLVESLGREVRDEFVF